MRRKRILPIVLLVILLPGNRLDATQSPVRRFIDELNQPGPSLIIDDVYRRVLPPLQPTFTFPLRDVPPHPTLRFSVGLRDKSDQKGTVHFAVVIQPQVGEPVPVYAKDFSEAGWHDERIDRAGTS